MRRPILALTSLAAVSVSAFAVDEVALKATSPNPPRTVLSTENLVSYNGSNVGGAEWDRPFADGTCCSGLGPVRLTTQLFSISANDTCDISSTQNGFDGYIFIYRDPFSSTAQTTNFVAGDDDGNGGIGTSDIMGLPLMGNTTYVYVTTGFANGDEGSFTNSINCPSATVTLGAFAAAAPVAAPSLDAFGLAALAGLLVLVGLVAVRSRG